MKKNEITKIILGSLAIAGGLLVVVVLPGLPAAFAPFMNKGKNISRTQFKRSFDKLSDKGLIGVSKDGDKTIVRLTKSGKKKVLKFKFEDLAIKKQVKWDKKWRIVIFDIPEPYRTGRNALAFKLRELGFVPLQKSVWIYPYPCEDEVDFVGELYEVRQFVRIITADQIDKQADVMKVFGFSE